MPVVPVAWPAPVPELLLRCAFPRPPAHGPALPPGGPSASPSASPWAGGRLVCGVSGGADSLALLALAVAAGGEVVAVHVDHGLRPGSAAEADTVAAAAAALGAAFCSVTVPVELGPNLEARARAARLGELQRVAGATATPGTVATGHTLDDRAETILLNLLRGAGPAGVADPLRPSPRHPLTRLRRAETHAVCAALGLEPVTDPSNRDPAFTRNRVRHDVLPLLVDVAGRDVAPLLVRFADLLAADADHLAAAAGTLDPTDARAVAGAPEPVAARALARWLADPYPPPRAALERVLAVARGEARACEVGAGVRVVRSGQRLRRQGR